ncbi:MAG: AAA family ATPase [Patescibacteria group bacterium]|nr:MAG: AAA family ATPase [Patescibacteria group bacterium]
MKVVIGLVGQKRAGKGASIEFLKKMAAPARVGRIGFSDVLFETLSAWGIEPSRENLQRLVVVMDDTYGAGTLTRAVAQRVGKTDADIIVLDGVRWETDVRMLREFPNNFLVYITADPHVRFERTRQSAEKAGEAEVTFRQFMKEEEAPNELLIPKIGAEADFHIINNRTLDHLEDQVKTFYETLLTPHSFL